MKRIYIFTARCAQDAKVAKDLFFYLDRAEACLRSASFCYTGADQDKPPCPSGNNHICDYHIIDRIRDDIDVVLEIYYSTGMGSFDFHLTFERKRSKSSVENHK